MGVWDWGTNLTQSKAKAECHHVCSHSTSFFPSLYVPLQTLSWALPHSSLKMALNFLESKLSDEMVALCRKVANCPQQLVDWLVTEELSSPAERGGEGSDSCYEPVARHRVVAHQAQVRNGARVVAVPYQHGAGGEHLDRPCSNR